MDSGDSGGGGGDSGGGVGRPESGVALGVRVGDSFRTDPCHPPHGFVGLRYEFKPASINGAAGYLEVHGPSGRREVRLEFPAKEDDVRDDIAFSGHYEGNKDVEAVLLFDPRRKTCTIERLGASVKGLKRIQDGKRATSKRARASTASTPAVVTEKSMIPSEVALPTLAGTNENSAASLEKKGQHSSSSSSSESSSSSGGGSSTGSDSDGDGDGDSEDSSTGSSGGNASDEFEQA